jgi:hypothetical protein
MTYDSLKKIGTKIDEKDYYNNGIYSFTREFWVCQSGLYVHEKHPNTNQYSGQTTTYQAEDLEDLGKINSMYVQAHIGLSKEGLERARAYAEKQKQD